MSTPVDKSGSGYYDFESLKRIARIMEASTYKGGKVQPGESKKKETPDGLLDVIILSKPDDIVKGGKAPNLKKRLKREGVTVDEELKDISGVVAKVEPEKLEALKEKGYLIYDNSPRRLVLGIPRMKEGPNPWEMPKIDPVGMTGSSELIAMGIDGTAQTVAVIDSGFQHPETPIVAWKDIVDESPDPIDPLGHGTHVAGDVKQTAPDSKIVAIRVMNEEGMGRPSDIVKGIQWAIANKEKYGIGIINLSLGSGPDGVPYQSDPINIAVERAIKSGITVVDAAGNSGPDYGTIGSPADNPLGITVGSALDKKKVSYFSSRGPTEDGLRKPDIVAPGEYIVSWNVAGSQLDKVATAVETIRKMNDAQIVKLLRTKPELIDALGLPKDILSRPPEERERLVKMALPPIYKPSPELLACPGTSFASPLIAGIVASLKEANPDARPDEIKEALMKTADDMGPYDANIQGKGFVNAPKAYQEIRKA